MSNILDNIEQSENLDMRTFKNLSDYAKNLYRTLDEMGRDGCVKIIAILPPDAGIGRAIRDRLVKGSGQINP
jgi:L-threonylcarbamoyladenylate synthase